MAIHWCGTGLSAVPGLRCLIQSGIDVIVWNRTKENAESAVGDLAADIRVFEAAALDAALKPGDTVVSMLPADWHVPLAKLAIARGANFVSSSYISAEMRALDQDAKTAGVALVNEVGLDPGIDHLMAHDLVSRKKAAGRPFAQEHVRFLSYCGGVPKQRTPFCYKFSWSPLGVLKALGSPSVSLKDGKVSRAERPWHALSHYTAPMPIHETFEVYPNRDSLPFMAQYEFDPHWKVKDFVRGTLRLSGWADAWSSIFDEIGTLQGDSADKRLSAMSDTLWHKHAYAPGEADRVVLCVELQAGDWHMAYVMDAWGDARGSAMARLVSIPVALAVRAVGDGEISAGVSAAPSDPDLVTRWLKEIETQAQVFTLVDRTADTDGQERFRP